MSTSQPLGKVVAHPTEKKRTRSGNVPLLPLAPKGQTRQNGAKVMSKGGKNWYKNHTESSSLSNVLIDRDILAHDLPQILRRMKELQMGFAFAEPDECNVSIVCEFYAKWILEMRSHFFTI